METIITIIVNIITSASVIGLIEFLIKRYDKKHDKMQALIQDVKELRLDTTRTELILLISKNEDKDAIMRVAERYFVELKGNWYMESIFKKWCKDNNIEVPDFVI